MENVQLLVLDLVDGEVAVGRCLDLSDEVLAEVVRRSLLVDPLDDSEEVQDAVR